MRTFCWLNCFFVMFTIEGSFWEIKRETLLFKHTFQYDKTAEHQKLKTPNLMRLRCTTRQL